MPFVSTKANISLTNDELVELETISRSRTEQKCRVERANMILDFHRGESISAIARNHGTNRPRVERQISKALQMGAIPSLSDLPRSGRRNEITKEAKAWVVSLACAKPTEFGHAHEIWTTRLLAEHARKHCNEYGFTCLAKLGRGTVSKILSDHEIKPHKIRYYLERRDPQFDEKMAEVLLVYKEVEMALLKDEDDMCAYISYDEKPGIQAIENTAPDLPPVPGEHESISRDHEYIRHWTVSLLAGIDLKEGIITATVQDRHRSAEFVDFLKVLGERYAHKERIKVILDNHSAHISKETKTYLATCPNRFEFIFTPKHASWLNLVETFFGKLARTMLRGIRVKSKDELKARIMSHIEYLNESPVVFRWKYKMDKDKVSVE